MSVFRENCHHGTNWRRGRLSVRSLGLTAAWESLADFGQAKCSPTWGAQESPAQGPGIDDRAGCLPAPSPGLPGFRRAPAFCCSPLLHAGGLSTVHQSRGPGPDRGHPLKCGYLLATHHRRPEGLLGLISAACCSLPGHSHPTLSWHPGPSFIHSPGWGGGQPLCIPGPSGTGFTPLPRLISHEALL